MSKVTVVSRPNRITIASKGVQGARGPEGPQGAQGLQGPKGDTGDVTPEVLAARDAAVGAASAAAQSAADAAAAFPGLDARVTELEENPAFPDAPDDGGAYIRVNGAWVQLYAPLALAGDLPDGTVEEPYTATLEASGGRAPYALGEVLLPPGLDATLSDATVTVAGTPTEEWEGEAHIDLSDALGTALRSVFDVGVGSNPDAAILAAFAPGDKGAFYDWSDTGTLAQNTTGTVSSNAPSDPIAYTLDKSARGNALIQETAGNAPLLNFDEGGVAYADTATARCLYSAAAFDVSGSDKITVIAWYVSYSPTLAVVAELTQNAVSTAGGFLFASPWQAGESSFGFVSRGVSNYGGRMGSGASVYHNGAVGFVGDLAAATGPDALPYYEFNKRTSGLTGNLGNAPGGGNFSAAHKINVGARAAEGARQLPLLGRLYGLLVVNRQLSAFDMAAVIEAGRKKYGFTIVGEVGDSTVAYFGTMTAVANLVPKAIARGVAAPGHSILAQKASWQALAQGTKDTLEVAVIQIGLNDLNPAEAASLAIGRIQDLVNTVRTDMGARPILVGKMIPCRARLINLYGATDGPVAYQKWLDMNAAIAGDGPTPITGVDGRITAHEPLLNDGSGNLAAAYDTGDGIHPNNAGRQITANAWTAALVELGLLTPTA